MNIVKKKLIFGGKKELHRLLQNNFNIQSMGQYIQLKAFYRSVDNSLGTMARERRFWLTFRNKLLSRMRRSNKGKLECFFCTKINLTANFKNPNFHKYDGKATLDHYDPLFAGGARFLESNLVCACNGCNNKKGHLSPVEFYNKYKKEINFNTKFIKIIENQISQGLWS